MTRAEPRVALVTGANRGLGTAIARALATAGLHVVVTARDSQAAETASARLTDEGLRASAHQLDISDPSSVVRAFADTGFALGRLDVLVNNATIAIDPYHDAASADMEKVIATLNTNLVGTWRCCVAAISEMRKHSYGRIVNLTTHLASLATMSAGSAAYRVSKTGVNALTRILAAELQGSGILVNAVSPGRTDTRLAYGNADHTPEQAADTPVWLATLPDDGPTGGLFYQREPLAW